MRRFVRLVRPEGGLNMLGGALFLALTMVLAVGTFDFAVFVARVHNAQWEAEGMALAAAKALRQNANQEDALRAARDWASLNNVDPSRIECCTVRRPAPAGRPRWLRRYGDRDSARHSGHVLLALSEHPGDDLRPA